MRVVFWLEDKRADHESGSDPGPGASAQTKSPSEDPG